MCMARCPAVATVLVYYVSRIRSTRQISGQALAGIVGLRKGEVGIERQRLLKHSLPLLSPAAFHRDHARMIVKHGLRSVLGHGLRAGLLGFLLPAGAIEHPTQRVISVNILARR